MKLTLVTSNEGKYRSFRNSVETVENLKLDRVDMDYPEDHDSNSTRKIARKGARHCFEKLGEPVIVSDGGLFIEAFNGFPGVNTGFVMDTLGNEGILNLMKNEENRKAEFQITVGYAGPERTETFQGAMKGHITRKKRGEEGFGFDPVFQPDGFEKTLAEKPELRDSEGPLPEALSKFNQWAKTEL